MTMVIKMMRMLLLLMTAYSIYLIISNHVLIQTVLHNK